MALHPTITILSSSLLYDRVFPRWEPKLRPKTDGAVAIEWLGTAGHVIRTKTTTVLVDPYVTRARLTRMASRIRPDEGAIERWIPQKVDAVLCGHSHFDHLLDAPHIAKKRGAKLAGSRTTCAFARATGVPEENLIEVPPSGARFRVGDIEVRFVPSLHAKIALGRVPFPGEVTRVPRLPARAWEYKMGGAFGLLLDCAGTRIYHNGSADLVDAELEGERADVVLMGLAGRQVTPGYVQRLLDHLKPKTAIPTHHDAFFAPLEDGLRLLPGIDLDGWIDEVSPHADVIVPDYGQTVRV